MIAHILPFILIACPVEETPAKEEPLMSCSCKKKRKSSYQEATFIACAFDEEPLLEEEEV